MITVVLHPPIQVEEETRDRLRAIGKKGESYDDIINRVLNELEQK